MRGIGLVITKGRHKLSPENDVNSVSSKFVCSVNVICPVQFALKQSNSSPAVCHTLSNAMSGGGSNMSQGASSESKGGVSGSAARRSPSQNKIPSGAVKGEGELVIVICDGTGDYQSYEFKARRSVAADSIVKVIRKQRTDSQHEQRFFKCLWIYVRQSHPV